MPLQFPAQAAPLLLYGVVAMPAFGAAIPTELHIPQAATITLKPVLRFIT